MWIIDVHVVDLWFSIFIDSARKNIYLGYQGINGQIFFVLCINYLKVTYSTVFNCMYVGRFINIFKNNFDQYRVWI